MVGKDALSGFQRPDTATRMRDILTQIAQDVADGKATYRMATVVTITPTTLEVEFTDEPGTTVELTNLPTLRPAAAGQMVEVLVRDRTQFTLWRVVGPTIMYDVTQFVPAPTDAVTGLVLTTANRAIVASWDVLDGASTYDVQRAKDSGFTTSASTVTVTGNQHTATNLTPGDGWYYRIRGRNDNGTGAWSGTLSIVVGTDTPAPTTPAVPGTPVVTNGELSQSITWTKSDTADYYELQWSQSATFASGITTQVVQGNVFVRNGLTKDNVWHYRVRAINTGGTSAYSAISAGATVVTGVPAPAGAPVQVVGLGASSAERSITVVWTPQAVATSYEIERSKSATFASGNVLQEVAGSILTIHNLIAGESWYFRVRAKNAAGTGTYSATLGPIAVNTDTPAPGAPAQVTGLALTTIPKQITAKWNVVSEAESYQVDRSPDSTFVTGTVTETTETNALIVSNLDPGSTWYFRVRGVNSTGNGTYSASANIAVMLPSAYTDGDVPSGSPTTTVTAGLSFLTATWPAQANADKVTYEVFISTVTGFTTYDATTKLGETDGLMWMTDKLPSGAKLVAGTTYYMRVRAKDNDGVAAVAGAQGSAQLTKVDLGLVGDFKYGQITGNGAVPGTPAAPTVSSGIGYLYATWARPTSPDPLTYEVHVGTSAGFAPDANTLSVVTDSLFAFIRKQGPGAGSADLVYGTTYYIKIIAKDIDGVSAASPAGSGFTVKALSTDITLDIGGTNRLSNSSFENATTPYSARPGGSASHTRENSAARAFDGVWSIKSTFTGTSDSNLFTVDLAPTAPGKWTISFRVRADTGWTAGALNVYPDGSPVGYVVRNPSVAAVIGQYVTVHCVIDVTAAQVGTAYPYVLRSASAITGQIVNVDAIQMEQGEVPTAYGPKPDEILPGTITQSELAAGAVTAAKTTIAAIDSASGNLVANSVAAIQIVAGSIVSSKLYTGAVEADRIQANNIAAGAITTEKMTANTINGDRISAGTLNAIKITAGSITSTQIYAGAVMADRIQAANIATGTITAASGIIADAAITTAKIGDGQITTAKIGDAQISTAKIGDGQILTAKIGDAQITTAKVGDAQITNAKIGTIQASKITTDTLSATLTVSGLVRTSSGTARVEMSSAGLYAYNSGGGTTFSIDSAGNAYFQGNIYAVNGTFTGYISSSAEISGGTLTGALIRSASSGARVSLGTFSYSASEMGQTYNFGPYPAVSFHNSSNVVRHIIYSDGTSLILEYTGSSTIYVQGSRIYMSATTDFAQSLTAWGIYEKQGLNNYRVYSPINDPYAGHTHDYSPSWHTHSYADTNHSHNYALSAHDHGSLYNYGTTSGGNGLSSDASYVRIHDGGGSQFRATKTKQLNANITGSADKAFIIDHPNPEKSGTQFLHHSCIEGPTADVFYRGEARLTFFQDPDWNEDPDFPRPTAGHGAATVVLPDYFEFIARKEGRTVSVTPILGCDDYDCPFGYGDGEIGDMVAPTLGVTRVKDGQFIVRTTGGYNHCCASFYWEVKAVRADVDLYDPEPNKSDYNVNGDGPYTYLTPA